MRVVNSISSNSTFNVGGTFNPDMTQWMASAKATGMKKALADYCKWVKTNSISSLSCEPPQPQPEPTPDPVPSNAVTRICVENHGLYRLWFELMDQSTTSTMPAQSDGFNRG